MRITNNLTGTHVNRLYSLNTKRVEKSIEKLTLGQRINRAVDDASGLAISEKLRGQIRGLRQGVRNAQDGISLIQTVEGALAETHNILHRMRELAVQSAQDTYVPADRNEIQNELENLIAEITRIAEQTEFNTKAVLDSESGQLELAISLGSQGSMALALAVANLNGTALGLLGEGDTAYNSRGFLAIQSAEQASNAIAVIDGAIMKVGGERTNLGSAQNQLESAIANLGVSIENLQASEAGFRDLELPSEVMELTKNQIIGSSINMLLAHANINPTSIVPLLLAEGV